MKDSNPEIPQGSENNPRVQASDPSPQTYPPLQDSQPRVIYGSPQTYPASQSIENAPNIIYASVPNTEQQAAIIVVENNLNPEVFGPLPIVANCPACKCAVTTRTQHTIGCLVWLMFLVFYIISPCISCIPFCVESWYDTIHYCPKCSRSLAYFSYV